MHTRSQGSKRFLTAMGLHSAKSMVVYEGEFCHSGGVPRDKRSVHDLTNL